MALACGAGMLGSTLLLSQLVYQETEPDSQLKNASGKKNPHRDRRSKSADTKGKESTEATTSEGAGKRRGLAPALLIIAAAGWGGASLALVLLASCFAGRDYTIGKYL